MESNEAEMAGQVSLIIEAHSHRHLRRRLSGQEATSRLVDSFAHQVTMRWDTEAPGETPDQVRLVPSEIPRHILQAMTLERPTVQQIT